MNRLSVRLALLLSVLCAVLQAHELRPAFLDIRQIGPESYLVIWKVPARGERERLALRLRFSEDVLEVGDRVGAFAADSHIQRFRIERPGGLTGTTLKIDGLAKTLTDVMLRYEDDGGNVVTERLTPIRTQYTFAPASGVATKAWTFMLLGVEHILVGLDHLLFVLGLMLIVNRRSTLIKTITAFTVAHSITLAIATLGVATVPAEPLNATIALSILFLGPEIVRVWRGQTSITIRYPWLVAFIFGLLHGFGFASGLSTTGMPASDIPLALLFFNVGVELGQLSFVFLALALAWSFEQLEIHWQPWVRALPGYVVGSLGAYWTIERTAVMFTL